MQSQAFRCAWRAQGCLDIKSLSIVFDDHLDGEIILLHDDEDTVCRRMLHNVGQRFLNDPVQRGFNKERQAGSAEAFGLEIHCERVGFGIFRHISLQSCQKAEVIQHTRPQTPGQATDFMESYRGNRPQ